ncbi:hypothetical protein C9374_014094 [Naegleria lovaniensis]|uniref:F-box domain-containing protein n=1 Tax=Naegleria lovaniensis TaxID=51637 RepID=A0AA88H127_NAELO|nr:uncharacterized protein C9374_014094 [Naegleria lovaniensis]KAG2389534.1 hypothetical protein C9374_014094 [Naegleria lovaniensis]
MSSKFCSDTLLNILQFLDGPSVVQSCMTVSHLWHQCATSNILWRQLFDQVFHNSTFEWNILETQQENSSSSNDTESIEMNDHDEEVNSDESDDDEEKGKKRKGTATATKQNKKKKLTETIHSSLEQHQEGYWYHLFKRYFSMLPVLDVDYNDLIELVNNNSSKFKKKISAITDVKLLHQIIFQLKEQVNEELPLMDSFRYIISEKMKNYDHVDLLLELCVILSVLYEGAGHCYWTDRVVVKAKSPNKTKQKSLQDIEESMVILPLAAFCMMILNEKAQDQLNLTDDDEDWCVSPLVSYTSELELYNDKDFCYFLMMKDWIEMDGSDELILEDTSHDDGWEWCPNFFNAGGSVEIKKISAYFEKENKVTVNAFRKLDYY